MAAPGQPPSFLSSAFDRGAHGIDPSLVQAWRHEFNAPIPDGEIALSYPVRDAFPDCDVFETSAYDFDLLAYAADPANKLSLKLANDSLLSMSYLMPATRGGQGAVALSPLFATYEASWNDIAMHVVFGQWVVGYNAKAVYWIAIPKAGDAARTAELLVHEVSSWSLTLRGEIWSFNSPGEWLKDKALYQSIQTARWADIILDEGMKRTVKEDVEGFFKKQHVYRDLDVPWKRGAIFKGPAGNGKTISLKALMRDTLREGIPTLYVRTFNRWGSDLEGLKAIFKKARSQAPCLVIIEDIDSLITDMNRSAFLNEVDGLEENEGMYIIASTNHFDRLDGALKNRPSRFDRKFTFDDPNLAERGQYAKYWQNKLASRDLGFTDTVAQHWAASTDGFSFAYCKESFISTLLFLAAHEGESSFAEVLQDQVASLRKELHADPDVRTLPAWDFGASPRGFAVPEVDMVETPLDRAQMVFARA